MRIFYPINIFTGLLTWLLTTQLCFAFPQPLRPTNGQLAAGNSHSLLLRPNGTLYAWGNNANGQLGNNSTVSSQTPLVVVLPAGKLFVQVATSNLHSLALASDGTVYAWGNNGNGQLGNNSTTQSTVPVAVTMPAGKQFVQVSAGGSHSLALASDGTLYAWGSNSFGQLGNNSTTQSLVPMAVTMPVGTQFVQVAAGGLHSLALASDGTLYAWGAGANGRLGTGSAADRGVPVAAIMPAGKRYVQIAAGSQHSLAVASDGTLYAWGRNSAGQLGNNSIVASSSPVAVVLPAGQLFVQVVGGDAYSLAVAADGTAYTWGNNGAGQLGNNSTTQSTVPVAVTMPAGKQFVQGASGSAHSLALASDGTLYAWGTNANGQLGNNSTTQSTVPVVAVLPAAYGYAQVAGGNSYSLGLRADGKAYAWGSNAGGALGDGTNTQRLVPVAVSQGAVPVDMRFAQVSTGFRHSLALAANGTLYAWGRNLEGQLGIGSTTNSNFPLTVSQGDIPVGTRFVQITAGYYHSLALAADGTLYAWGLNSAGQLGDGTTTNRTIPVAVTMPAGVRFVQVSAANAHSLALAADGTVYAWGTNFTGQVGIGTAAASLVPVAVSQGDIPVGTRFVQVAAGSDHSLALAADGTLYAWGFNSNGQVGDNTTINRTAPVAVSLGAASVGTRFVRVVGGQFHSLALAADGTLYGWGLNSNGQLGDGTTITPRLTPVAESSRRTTWRGVASGPSATHSLGLGSEAAVFTAGLNGNGQLGDGTTTDSPTFARNRAPLPVELSSFTAQANGRTAHLKWTTATEKNSARFEVERSLDGEAFAKVGAVAAAGSSSTARTYTYTDASAPAGLVYYRLRQVDLDGTATYSPVRTVTLAGAVTGLTLVPNPTRTATLASGLVAGAAVDVFDTLGRPVLHAQVDAAGQAALALPTGLAPGMYLVRSGARTSRLVVE